MDIAGMVRIVLVASILIAGLLPGRLMDRGKLTGSATQRPVATQDHQHDFDFEVGSWNAHLRRLAHPLSGSKDWAEYDGTSIVREVWDGAANLGELNVNGPAGHIQGMTLRLYNPESHRWSIYWANRKDGNLNVPPMVGNFENGRGEFYDHETFQGKPIMVRFIFSDVTLNSFQLEQAFSPDGGKTWEPNWISTFTREKGL